VELATFIVMSLTFFILAVNEDDFPRNIIYYVLCTITSFMTSLLLLATNEAFSLATQWAFVGLGMISFACVLFESFSAYKVRINRRWET